MEYSYRPHLFQKRHAVRVANGLFEVLNAEGQAKRSQPLTDINRICFYFGGTFDTSDGGKTSVEHCSIRFDRGLSVNIKSASYSGPGAFDDHGPAYRSFTGNLIDQLAQSNADVTVCEGDTGMVIFWIILGILSVCGFFAGIAFLLSTFFTGKPMSEVFVLSGNCLLLGTLGFLASLKLTRAFQPKRYSLQEFQQIRSQKS